MVAVQVGDEHGGDLTGVEVQALRALSDVAPQSRSTGS